MAGSGTMTPITTTPGAGGTGGYGGGEPTPWTLLTLPRYAKLLGIDPLHFMGGYSALRPAGTCNSIWAQYDWQDRDKISRQQLGYTIFEAERDIADQIGYWPAPVWIADERQHYPRPKRTDLYQSDGTNARGRWKSCRLKWGWVIEGGQRAETLLSHVHGADLDLENDTYDETAQFVVTMDADTEACEVRAYFKEYNAADEENCRTDPASTGADPFWEVPIESRSEAGANLTVYIRKWNMFSPQLRESLASPTVAIDADVATNYVDDLVFYRVWTDPEDQVEFLWGSDASCYSAYAGSYTTQAGAFGVRDPRSSIVVPEPATWDSTTSLFSKDACWTEGRDPDYVRFWYYCGYRPERMHACEDLDHWWAETIAMLATARLALPLCSCSTARRKFEWWQMDLSEVGAERSFNIDPIVVTNPFGTRRGEVEAWRRLVKARGRQRGQAILV